LAALGREWLQAWNSRDLDPVLTLAEHASDRIPALGFDASGTVGRLTGPLGQGAAAHLPNLHFNLCEPWQRRGVLLE